MTVFTRRNICRTMAGGSLAGFAGCMDNIPFLSSNSDIELTNVGLNNHDEEDSHKFNIRVERDGEVVHESSHTLEQKTDSVAPGVVADCTWKSTSGQYVVFVSTSNEEWTSVDINEQMDDSEECAFVHIIYKYNEFQFNIFQQCDENSIRNEGCGSNETNN